MQITSYYPNVSINTANPATEQARRDMQRREPIEPVKELEKGAAERPLATDDRQRGAANSSANVTLYDANGKETETQQAITGEQGERGEQEEKQESGQQSEQEQQQQQAEQREIRELQARDQEVRAHEQAHAIVGGRYASAPSYDYQQGPDGKRYAVGGEVQIDLAPVPGDPAATVQKMQQVKAAALAPAEPSAADRSIAAEAGQRLLQAQAELIAEKAPLANAAASDSSMAEEGSTATESQLTQAEAADIVLPQRERLEWQALMARRSQVIENFYQLATEPAQRPLRQQV
ncbi:MAG: putative metalloprotease CJM1_0395 family protein [Alishewanella aestuarii]